MPDIEFTVAYVPVWDTGIGISLGFASDRDFIRYAESQDAKLTPEVRRIKREIERKLDLYFIYGRDYKDC